MLLNKIKVLIIEDNIIDGKLLDEFLLHNEHITCEIEHATRLIQAISKSQQQAFDVVIMDLGLPDNHGLETYLKFRDLFPNIPVIIITGYDNDELAKKAVEEGATDFIVKGNFNAESLIQSIRFALRRNELRSNLEKTLKDQEPPEDPTTNIGRTGILFTTKSSKQNNNEAIYSERYSKLIKAANEDENFLEDATLNILGKLTDLIIKNNFNAFNLDQLSQEQKVLDSKSEILTKVNIAIVKELIIKINLSKKSTSHGNARFSQREPELFKKTCDEYQSTLLLCLNANINKIKQNIEEFFNAHLKILTVLNLSTKDLDEIHNYTLESLGSINRESVDFKKLELYLILELYRNLFKNLSGKIISK